jgi:hypothetical protein
MKKIKCNEEDQVQYRRWMKTVLKRDEDGVEEGR